VRKAAVSGKARYRQQSEGAVRPKYLRIQAACIYAGCCRQLLYQWINAGSVKSVLVKSRPDSKSGMRMCEVQSIDDHLSSFVESKDGRLATGTAA
jgi:hypothetical protein